MHCVGALSSGAIALLGAAVQIADQAKGAASRRPTIAARRGSVSQNSCSVCQTCPPISSRGLAAELRSLNLLHITEGAISAPDLGHFSIGVTPLGLSLCRAFH